MKIKSVDTIQQMLYEHVWIFYGDKRSQGSMRFENQVVYQEIQELNDQGNIIQVQNLQFPFKIMDDGLIQKGID